MPDLVLGPLVRYVSDTAATIWVETDERCEVSVLGAVEPTFRVEGHHYALVRIEGLKPGTDHPYDVRLDGEVRWPEPDSPLPPSSLRTLGGAGPLDIAFGSCRVAVPHEEPYTKSKDEDEHGHEVDALWVLADEITRDGDRRPDLLFMLGDQIYVDEGSPETRRRIERKRGTKTAPENEVTDFQEYTWLYQESWSEPLIRWLFANVSTSMLWDDHDMSDDWNISGSWIEEMRERAWWHRRAIGCISSYWIYQHLGNLSPDALDEDNVYKRVRGNQHAEEVLFDWAEKIESTGAGVRWSFCRDLNRTRAIFVDSRAGRVLDEGARRMVDDAEWEWIVDKAEGDFDHLLIATTVPWLLSPGLDRLEAWNEKVCDGAHGERAARLAERLRRSVDFDHWGSFSHSFRALRDLLGDVAAGRRGAKPASVVVMAGDVHHAYLCEVGWPAGEADGKAPIYQAVCSPYRNPLSSKEQRVIRAGFTRPFTQVAAALAKAAGAEDPGIRWRLRDGPCFDNQVATLHLDGRTATMRLDKTTPGDDDQQTLECSFERRLT
ncbi:MAG TPA: alkaline phosphatase D family protein [Solirubrobacterales bacterium]|nr:alkaline phosphatase D family protein [Solirubrobacterales bacterium]